MKYVFEPLCPVAHLGKQRKRIREHRKSKRKTQEHTGNTWEKHRKHTGTPRKNTAARAEPESEPLF